MLDQLVESKSNTRENTRRSGFLLSTFVVLTAILLGGWVYSLFALDYGLGAGDLELSTLVSPVQIAEEAPPPPEPEQKEEKQVQQDKPVDVAMRKENILRLDESPPDTPPPPSTQKSTAMARPPGTFVLGDRDVRTSAQPQGPSREVSGGGGSTLAQSSSQPVEETRSTPVPTPPPIIKPTPKPPPKTISGGVVNGKASNLVKPAYPAAAKAIRASGAVNVQVTIDENGNVVSASAVSGHPLLRAAAVQAARASKFTPTKLSGEPVKVTGVIIYNFTQ
ncbi:MAG: TonB family protein [Acidobacteria bacterium]|nr:TonB family protein [Acidobacteriota bacterium]